MRSTGKYVRQLEGYRAFIPEEIPPSLPIQYDEEIQTLLSKADRALGRLDGSIEALPNPDLFVFMYVRKEAVLSSQIEGTQASLGDVLEVEAQIFDPLRPNDTDEILNYVSAMNYGLELLQELPISLRLIRNIHDRLMRGVRGQHATPGEFRATQNWIGPAGVTLSEASFVPPPPHELPRLLGNLEKYINEDNSTPILIKLGIIHAQFETLHPFLDGNGRMGRLLVTFCLCERDVLKKPVLYISHYLKRNRATYYEKLQSIRDEGRWEDWIKFFLRGVSEVSNEATETARQIVQLREKHREAIVADFGKGAANALRFLETLYVRPIFTVSTASDYLEISNQAANSLTEKLTQKGFVREVTGNKRNRVFRYDPYVSLFID